MKSLTLRIHCETKLQAEVQILFEIQKLSKIMLTIHNYVRNQTSQAVLMLLSLQTLLNKSLEEKDLNKGRDIDTTLLYLAIQ